jgi:hypothetical protein
MYGMMRRGADLYWCITPVVSAPAGKITAASILLDALDRLDATDLPNIATDKIRGLMLLPEHTDITKITG